jgi:hypothetical protein
MERRLRISHSTSSDHVDPAAPERYGFGMRSVALIIALPLAA